MIILSSEGLKINNETVGFTITQPSSPITKNQKTGDTLDLEKNPNAIIECELKNALIVTSTYACEFEYDGHQYNFNAKVTNQVYSAKDGYKVKLQIVGKVVVGGKSTAPTISYDNTTFTVSASGQGEMKMYVDGVETVSPHTFDAVGTYVVTATAEQDGKAISDTVTENITIAKTATPTISYDDTTFTVSASGQGTVKMYVDGVETVSPHTFTQGESDVTYVVTATAIETGKFLSDTVTENCLVPAASQPEEQHTYTVVGNTQICGSNWNPTDTNNDMVDEGDNVYLWTKEGVQINDSSQTKIAIVQDRSWSTRWPAQDYDLELTEGVYNIEIQFNADTEEITDTIIPV